MEKNSLIATLVILALGFLAGFNLIYLPGMKQLRALEATAKEEQLIGQLYDEVKTLKKKVTAYAERRFTPGKEEIELLNRVREIADETQVRVISMMPEQRREKKRGKKGYEKFSLTLHLEGSYHQLGEFISKIENEAKFIKIDFLQFSAETPREGSHYLVCRLTLSIFSIS